jgi:uncharacterized protein (DUF58 family)
MRGQAGARLGAQAGTSLDFHDYREYQPGDDLRHLDWNVYARSDKEIIKLYREEVAPRLDLVLDGSRSMRLAGTPKAESALTLAAACAVAAENAHCTHEVWVAGEQVEALAGSRGDPSGWALPAFDAPCPPDEALFRAAPRWRRHGIRVFVSDLLWPADPEAALRRLHEGAASLTVVQILAAEEESPELRGQYRFVDVESGERLDVFADAAACATYTAALGRHRERWSRACRRFGARFVTVSAERLTEGGRLRALEQCGMLEA